MLSAASSCQTKLNFNGKITHILHLTHIRSVRIVDCSVNSQVRPISIPHCNANIPKHRHTIVVHNVDNTISFFFTFFVCLFVCAVIVVYVHRIVISGKWAAALFLYAPHNKFNNFLLLCVTSPTCIESTIISMIWPVVPQVNIITHRCIKSNYTPRKWLYLFGRMLRTQTRAMQLQFRWDINNKPLILLSHIKISFICIHFVTDLHTAHTAHTHPSVHSRISISM